MKRLFSILIWQALFVGPGLVAEESLQPEETVVRGLSAQITKGSEEIALAQDELSADVMELVESQTVPQVIELLEDVEQIMAEVTDNLIEEQTGGETLAAQTEIIEKIFAAAQKKQQSSGESSKDSKKSMGAMLDMMERMMGRNPQGEKPSPPKEGEQQPGNQAGKGSTGDSDTANNKNEGDIGENKTRRIIPKGSGAVGQDLPNEFREILDAYNRRSLTP